jgi:hypothetical protein
MDSAGAITRGGEPEDHFQPGASAGASKRDRITSEAGSEGSSEEGSNSNVMEKPSILRLVLGLLRANAVIIWLNTHHETARQYPFDGNSARVHIPTNFGYDSNKFEFTQTS